MSRRHPLNTTNPNPYCFRWIRIAWAMHFLVCLLVICHALFMDHPHHHSSGSSDSDSDSHHHDPSVHYDRKYIPITASPALPHCQRGFLNVWAVSAPNHNHINNKKNAIVCCEQVEEYYSRSRSESHSGNRNEVEQQQQQYEEEEADDGNEEEEDDIQADLCKHSSSRRRRRRFWARISSTFPLASRISRFPEAWLLPLFPLLFRLVYLSVCRFYIYMYAANDKNEDERACSSSAVALAHATMAAWSITLKRLAFYVSLFAFRGYVLYVLFNYLEQSILVVVLSSFSNNDENSHSNDKCWYLPWLQPLPSSSSIHNHHRFFDSLSSSSPPSIHSTFDHSYYAAYDSNEYSEYEMYSHSQYDVCRGRAFDFSDHMVLYCAQLLPVALMETVDACLHPYYGRWYTVRRKTSKKTTKKMQEPQMERIPKISSCSNSHNNTIGPCDSPLLHTPALQLDPSSSLSSLSSSSPFPVMELRRRRNHHPHHPQSLQDSAEDSESSTMTRILPAETTAAANEAESTVTIKAPQSGLIRVTLSLALVYLYVITLAGVDRTIRHFHTRNEILVGYVVSCILQVPLALLHCGVFFVQGSSLSLSLLSSSHSRASKCRNRSSSSLCWDRIVHRMASLRHALYPTDHLLHPHPHPHLLEVVDDE